MVKRWIGTYSNFTSLIISFQKKKSLIDQYYAHIENDFFYSIIVHCNLIDLYYVHWKCLVFIYMVDLFRWLIFV